LIGTGANEFDDSCHRNNYPGFYSFHNFSPKKKSPGVFSFPFRFVEKPLYIAIGKAVLLYHFWISKNLGGEMRIGERSGKYPTFIFRLLAIVAFSGPAIQFPTEVPLNSPLKADDLPHFLPVILFF
jgi:hypothetical protein